MTATPPKSVLSALRELLAYVRPWRGRFLAATIATAVATGLGVTMPWFLGQLWDAALPSVKVVTSAWKPTLGEVAGWMMTCVAAQVLLTFFASYHYSYVGEQAVVALRRELYARLLGLPMNFHSAHRVGELASRLSSDLAQIQETLVYGLSGGLRQAVLLAGGLCLVSLTAPWLAAVMLCSLALVLVLCFGVGSRVRIAIRKTQDAQAEGAVIVEETLQGVATVKAFGNESHEIGRFTRSTTRYLDAALHAAWLRASLIAAIMAGVFISLVLVMWEGGRMMQAGALTHGELSRFVISAAFVAGSASSIGEVISQLQRALGATDRAREILGSEPESIGAENPVRLGGEVAFENVGFSYATRAEMPVLSAIQFHVKPGEKIALVGPSGAGKTTLVSLLLRYYQPESGRVLFDGKNAADLPLASIRAAIALVPQEVLLFGGTIRDNIAYGRPAATDDDIRDAARRAHCLEFIESFPNGFSTLVGERGVQLSGGQRQRVAIARAILRDPAILILDEATSSLDSESERLIQQALDDLLPGRTAFIIAHRLATIRRCDRIHVLRAGTIIESGTHDELIQRPDGFYRRLAELQFADIE